MNLVPPDSPQPGEPSKPQSADAHEASTPLPATQGGDPDSNTPSARGAPSPESLQPNYGESIDFLSRFSPDRPWCLVAIVPDTSPPRIVARTFSPSQVEQCRQWIADKNKTANVYFTVNPIRKPIAKKPKRTDIAEVRWLHVDIDPESGKPLAAEQARIRALFGDPPGGIPKPTWILFSGGGYQAFWRRRVPRVLNGTVEDADDAGRENKGLEQLLGGDHCHNVDRVMRLPGTINWPDERKRKKGRVPAVARLLFGEEARVFDIEQFRAVAPEDGARRSKRKRAAPAKPDAGNRLVAAPDGDASSAPDRATRRSSPLPPGDDWIDLSTPPSPERLEALLGTPRFLARWNKDPEGMKDTSMSSFAMAIASIAALKGSDAREIVTLVCAFYRHYQKKPPTGESFWRSTVTKALLGAEEAQRTDIAFDDYHLADLFARDNGAIVRYCRESDTWYLWDGKRWRADAVLEVQAKARQTLESFAHVLCELAAQLDEDDKTFANKLRSYATRILSPKVAATCLEGARSTGVDEHGERICLPRIAFDDPKTTGHLLNCANGVVDLRTGVLHPHESCKHLLITQLCPVPYKPEAECPVWLQTVAQIFEADVDPDRAKSLIHLLSCALGISLSAEQAFHVVVVLYGPGGRNGKSLIVRIVLTILGRDYAVQAPPGLLRVKRGEAHPTELADLHRRRFVPTVETGRGERLDEALVKQLSGGDRIKARRMREDFWEFDPTHHLWLATNRLPRADSSDQALFTRFRVIPFRRRFLTPSDEGYEACDEVRRADNTLEGRILESEQEGVLAWMVQGGLECRRLGAVPNPQASQDATTEYREENDPLAEWLDEQCETKGSSVRDRRDLGALWVTETAALYANYVAWKKRRNEFPIAKHGFSRALTEKGFPAEARLGHDGARARRGIRLRCPPGQQPDSLADGAVPF